MAWNIPSSTNMTDTSNNTTGPILTSLPELDAMRTDPNSHWIRDAGSNVDVSDTNNTTGTDTTPLMICHLEGIQPFTYGDYVAQQIQYEDAAAIAMAAHHLNTGDGRLVPQVKGLPSRCNIRFTVEFGDTQYTPSVGVDYVVNVTSRTPGVQRLPCAFVGAYRSAVSIATSIITGLRNYPQVSGGSTSADLNDKMQYPLFARTIPSDDGNAVPIIQFIYEALGVKHLAVLNFNDAYGNSYVQGLRNAAEKHAPGMTIYQASVDEQTESIQSALAGIKKTQYRYIFAVVYTSEVHDKVLSMAYEMGIAGTGYHQWLFGDSFDGIAGRTIQADSPLVKAYRGIAKLEATGGVPGIGLTGYDKFLKYMAEMNNPDDLKYLFSLLPNYDMDVYQESLRSFTNYLTEINSVQATFVYEATIALGLSACAAVNPNNFTLEGKTHYETMVTSVFDGITGKIVFDPATGTKDPTHTMYKVTNYFDSPSTTDGMVLFSAAVTNIYQAGAWRELTPFVFNDGSHTIPSDIPESVVTNNTINLGVRISVLVLCGIILVLGVGLMAWTHRNRKARVVLASQPFFLHIICVGAIVMACTIIPLSIDHGVVDLDGCTRACISVPWLSSMGFSMTVSALFTKTHRINILLNNANRMQRIKVTIWDVAKPMIFLLSVNSIILSVMTALSPPEYEMIVENEDSFGRPDEIRGQCDFSVSYAYIGSVSLVNAAALLFTIIQAVKARNLSMEFAESAQIFRALVAITMVMFVGGPVLLLSRDNANTLLFVASAIIFVACASILLLLFVPKIQFWLNAKKQKGNRRLYISGIEMSRPSTASAAYDSTVEDDDEHTTEEFTGMKILTTKTREELLKENEALKRLLRKKLATKGEGQTGSSDELESLTRFEVKSNPNLRSILKKSKEFSQARIEEEDSDDLEKSQGTIGTFGGPTAETLEEPSIGAIPLPPAATSPASAQDEGSPYTSVESHKPISAQDEGSPSTSVESHERLVSLRERKELAKMKFETLISRDSSERHERAPSDLMSANNSSSTVTTSATSIHISPSPAREEMRFGEMKEIRE